MKRTDWEILSILFNTKSMTKAAEKLYITQSALTKRIKAMETEWGVEIVKRSSTGVSFTEDGRYLVRKANVMIDFLDEIAAHFAENKSVREQLRIGQPNSFARSHMPALLKSYNEAYGGIQIKLLQNPSDVLMRQLTEGHIDMAIICGDYPYIGEKCCLFEENLHAVVPVGTKLEDIEYMPLIESMLNPMVKMTVDQWWKSHFGSIPHEEYSVPYSDIAIEMVEQGLGAAFLFGNSWNLDLQKVTLIPVYDQDGVPVSRKVWMMIGDYCYKSQSIMDFVSFVEQYYKVNI